ncbi:uncharacterized protein LTR77_007121 [Saxophila tyrrhenica]|uniref:Uncharacterized protein n=1 Tax=Saxophila tyrrhenica TaxID=1690608 RepID=A0AAV9P6R2_9PEZI|nr:hypothetical protein LTR77_007121 [Saxophila tyrrhenica]
MQFLTLATLFFGSAFAANPQLEGRGTKSVCSSVGSCVAKAGNAAAITSFCDRHNGVPTTTIFSGTSTFTYSENCGTELQPSASRNHHHARAVPTAPSWEAPEWVKRDAAAITPLVQAPEKPRCLKKLLDGHLSKACSCFTDSTVTVTSPASVVSSTVYYCY